MAIFSEQSQKNKKKQKTTSEYNPKNLNNAKLFILYIVFISLGYLKAQSTGAVFLKIPIGAKATGLGSAFTAISNDITAIYYNPAGLVQLNKKEISITHTEWIANSKFDFIGYAQPSTNQTIGLGLTYLSYGEIEAYNKNRQQIGTFSAQDLAITTSYSKFLTNSLSIGLNFKFIQQNIESEKAAGFGFDLGILKKLTQIPLQIGFAFKNIGPELKFIKKSYPLPLTLSVGACYTLFNFLILASDINYEPINNHFGVSFGSEYTPISSLSLRLGYLLTKEKISTIGAGFGLKLFNCHLDYCFLPYSVLGDTHRLSFTLRF